MEHTCQCFEIRRVFPWRSLPILACCLPIGPNCNVLEALVVHAVFYVLGVENPRSATGVNDVVKLDDSADTI